MATAYTTGPRPPVPPSRKPTASTVTSMLVRITRTEPPVRRTSPVISPSRGPGPRPAPMYAAPATPVKTTPAVPAPAHAVEDHAGAQHRELHEQGSGGGEERQCRVDREPDHHHVADRP